MFLLFLSQPDNAFGTAGEMLFVLAEHRRRRNRPGETRGFYDGIPKILRQFLQYRIRMAGSLLLLPVSLGARKWISTSPSRLRCDLFPLPCTCPIRLEPSPVFARRDWYLGGQVERRPPHMLPRIESIPRSRFRFLGYQYCSNVRLFILNANLLASLAEQSQHTVLC